MTFTCTYHVTRYSLGHRLLLLCKHIYISSTWKSPEGMLCCVVYGCVKATLWLHSGGEAALTAVIAGSTTRGKNIVSAATVAVPVRRK